MSPVDHQALAELLHRYAEAVDVLGNAPVTPGDDDPALPRAVALFSLSLAPDARMGIRMGGPAGALVPMGSGPAGFAASVRAYFSAYGYVGTSHLVANLTISPDGQDAVRLSSAIDARHWLVDGRMLLTPVRYHDTARRGPEGWRITEREIVANRFWIADGYAPDPLDPSLARR